MPTQSLPPPPAILPFLLIFAFAHAAANVLHDRISINCGSASPSSSLRRAEWMPDVPKFSSSAVTIKGISSRTSVTRDHPIVDPVPYGTARVSTSPFSYDFNLIPGQKYVRLHFNPTSYKFNSGIFRKRLEDCFSVEAGSFTLLTNFSASVTARARGLNVITKEFCVYVHDNLPFSLVFTPAVSVSPSQGFYAFINGIEIISVPSGLSYCHDGDAGVQILGQKSVVYIDSSTALEMAHRVNVKRDLGASDAGDDSIGVFRMGTMVVGARENKGRFNTWKVVVDVGFRYLIRLHFCEMCLKMAENESKDFMILIDSMIAATNADLVQEREGKGILWYKSYMAMVNGNKQEGLRDISISLRSKDEFVNGYGPLEGFEIFKMSNNDQSLASPNPLPPTGYSHPLTAQNLLTALGPTDVITSVVIMLCCLVNIVVRKVQQSWECNLPEEEENMPSIKTTSLCRRFSLDEIQSATDNFFDGFVIGKGGFGKVYRGLIDNGNQTVAIKRLKPSSSQGKREFQTEIELLSKLRHVNVVSLVGYCSEKQEMILVYEHALRGSLADHLYRLAREDKTFHSLSWKQRLEICIGAGRGLDYLHTGHGIIHRDIKATNILLDDKFVAKVSDFGLAKIHTGQSQESTNFKGTFGYFDPAYFRTHRLTVKSDTYSFGVMLLEVLCGRPAVEQWAEEENRSLTMWAQDKISRGEVDQIIASSLRDEISSASLNTFVRIVERCLDDDPKNRPAIAHVIINLEFALEQQEKANSLVPNEIVGVADALPITDAAQPMNVNDVSQNDIEHVAVLPQQVNEIEHVPVSPQQVNAKSNLPNVAENAAETRTIADVSAWTSTRSCLTTPLMVRGTQQEIMTSSKGKNDTSSLKNVVKTTIHMLSRLLPWDARKSGKSSKTKESIGPMSAPVARWTPNKKPSDAQEARTLTNVSSRTRMRSFLTTPFMVSGAEQETLTSLKKKNVTSALKNLVKTAMRKLSRLWPRDERKSGKSSMRMESIFPISALVRHWIANKKPSDGILSQNKIDKESILTPNLRVFSLNELRISTRNFRPDTMLGEGGFGRVFKGFLKENGVETAIAVKRMLSDSEQGIQEWLSEIKFLGKLSHPNLVKLLGYCCEDNELLLVYEYMKRGSLEIHLFRRGGRDLLPWDIMLNILIGAARGLAYLHAAGNLIHRDFKASNILLDESFNPKLSDFGLTKMGPDASKSHVTTQVIGTNGYAAPEYVATGHLYVKSDVYSLGVVLLEMLTGRRALDFNRPAGEQNLVEWIKPHLSNRRKLIRFMDSRLQGFYPVSSVFQIAQLAQKCLQPDPKRRPSSEEVADTLEKHQIKYRDGNFKHISRKSDPPNSKK